MRLEYTNEQERLLRITEIESILTNEEKVPSAIHLSLEAELKFLQGLEKNHTNLANEIVELFEELLDEKGIEIPCSDVTEQQDRHEGGNAAKLYGMEYWGLVEKVESLLPEYPCRLRTSIDGTADKLKK